MSGLKHYRLDIIATVVVGFVLAFWIGPQVLPLFLLLVVVEIALSGDNAVVNVKLLKLMSPIWVLVFMTAGILVAAGFMRFVFPILIVAFSSGLDFGAALNLSLTDHEAYAAAVLDNEGVIAIFGGIYLLMIALGGFTEEAEEDEDKLYWIPGFERTLDRVIGFFPILPIVLSIVVIVLSGLFTEPRHQVTVLIAGLISLGTNLTVSVLSDKATEATEKFSESGNTSRAGLIGQLINLMLFVAIEFQDAAFSFDGVAGGLAITTDPRVLAAGLGIGALFVRSATKHLMETDKLAEFRFLGHGAYYAILVLAISQLISPFVHIEGEGYIVGVISVALIGAATWHSHLLNKKEGTHESIVDEVLGIDVEPDNVLMGK